MELLKHAAITHCFSTSSTELSSRWLEFGMHNLMCWDGTIARSLSWSETAAEFAVSQPLKLFFLQTNKRDALELTIKLRDASQKPAITSMGNLDLISLSCINLVY